MRVVLEDGPSGFERNDFHAPKSGGKARLRDVLGEPLLQFGEGLRWLLVLGWGRARDGQEEADDRTDAESAKNAFHAGSVSQNEERIQGRLKAKAKSPKRFVGTPFIRFGDSHRCDEGDLDRRGNPPPHVGGYASGPLQAEECVGRRDGQ